MLGSSLFIIDLKYVSLMMMVCIGGNVRFRKLVDEHAPAYVKAETKYEKTKVIADLIDRIRNDSPDGGFVKKDFYSGRWYEIGIERARDKVGHAIRKAADKIMEKSQGGGHSKHSKSAKVATSMKTQKGKAPVPPDNVVSQDDNGTSGVLPSRGPFAGSCLVDSQSMPTSFPASTNVMPQSAYFHGIGGSPDAQRQHFPRDPVSDSMVFTRHSAFVSMIPTSSPRGESHNTHILPPFHHDNRSHHTGSIFSMSGNGLSTASTSTDLVRGTPSSYVFQQNHHMSGGGNSMLPPHQRQDISTMHAGFGRSATSNAHLFPSVPSPSTDSTSAFQQHLADNSYVDQHFSSYAGSYSSGSTIESMRQIRPLGVPSYTGGEMGFNTANVEHWDSGGSHDTRDRNFRWGPQQGSGGEMISYDFAGDSNARRYNRPEE